MKPRHTDSIKKLVHRYSKEVGVVLTDLVEKEAEYFKKYSDSDNSFRPTYFDIALGDLNKEYLKELMDKNAFISYKNNSISELNNLMEQISQVNEKVLNEYHSFKISNENQSKEGLLNAANNIKHLYSNQFLIIEEKSTLLKKLNKENGNNDDEVKKMYAALLHDLRNPLVGIKTAMSLIIDDLNNDEMDNLFINETISLMDKEMSYFNRMIDSFKQYLSSGKQEIKSENVNVNNLISDLALSSKRFVEDKDLKFKINYDISEISIKSDYNIIERIFTNLVSNAIKFTERGYVEIGCNANNNMLQFYVKDSGKGISEFDKNKLFLPYKKASNNSGEKGYGLGLSIVKQYVEQLGGKISVDSKLNQGSTFYVELPLNQKN